jgi:hypothetical protein
MQPRTFANGLMEDIFNKITQNISKEWLNNNETDLMEKIHFSIRSHLSFLQRAGNGLVNYGIYYKPVSYNDTVSEIVKEIVEEMKPEYTVKLSNSSRL